MDTKLRLESDLSWARACFFHLRRFKSTRRILGADVMSGLVYRLLWQPEWITATPFWQHFLSRQSIHCNGSRMQPPDSSLAPEHENTWLLRFPVNFPVKFRKTFKLYVLYMQLVHIGRAPAYLSDMVTATADLSSRGRLRSSNTFRNERPLLKRKFGERSFSYAGLKAWNDLSFALQELTDMCTLKRHLKTHL